MDRQRCVECGERFDPAKLRHGRGRRVTCSWECSQLRRAKVREVIFFRRHTSNRGIPVLDSLEFANAEHRAKGERVMEVF